MRVRALGHAVLLGLLTAGTVYGIVMLADYAVMILAAAAGWMPVPELDPSQVVFGGLMVALWGGVIVAWLRALLRQCRRGRALARWVAASATAPSEPLAAAITAAERRGLVVEVPDRAAYAFTYGIWHPRVVVSSGLVAAATHAELVAVLRHEGYHVDNRDPLKVLALRTWSAAFFLVPLVGAVLRRLLDRQELKADRAAIDHGGAAGVTSLAGALLKAVDQPAAAPGTALAALGGPELLEERITQLETGDTPRVLAAFHSTAMLTSLPGVGLIAAYGVLLYQVCIAVQYCCLH